MDMISIIGWNRTYCSKCKGLLEKPRNFERKDGFTCNQCKHARTKEHYCQLRDRKKESLIRTSADPRGFHLPAEFGSFESENETFTGKNLRH